MYKPYIEMKSAKSPQRGIVTELWEVWKENYFCWEGHEEIESWTNN